MPLTPADVHNVAFSKPPIGKRGYNEDEVDAFLDELAAGLPDLPGRRADLPGELRAGDLLVFNQLTVIVAPTDAEAQARLRERVGGTPIDRALLFDRERGDGRAYLEARALRLADWPALSSLAGLRLQGGQGDVRAWARLRAKRLQQAQVDLDLRQVRLGAQGRIRICRPGADAGGRPGDDGGAGGARCGGLAHVPHPSDARMTIV